MTPEELYRYDVNGYLYIEDAIAPDYLGRLNERLDVYLAAHPNPSGPSMNFDDPVNHDETFVDLIVNPRVLPYIVEMVDCPRLKSTWVAFKWKGGWARDIRSTHTPSCTCNFYHFNGGRIYHNLFQVFYAMRDIGPGEGGLRVIPGSHKANFPLPVDADRLRQPVQSVPALPNPALSDMEVEIPMKAGSVLLFTHDMYHASLNASDKVRRVIIFTYCPGVIANTYGGDTLYQCLFEKAPEGSWLKYLLRRPNGGGDSYPKPDGRSYDAG